MRRGFAVGLALIFSSARALADGAPPPERATALQSDLVRDEAVAMGSDCATACRAVDSMRRSVERICSLDPGDACAHARDTLRKASEHVRVACPECALAKTEAPPVTVATKPAEAPPPATADELSVQRQGRGCGGCETTSDPVDGLAAIVPWALGLAWLARRRRRRE